MAPLAEAPQSGNIGAMHKTQSVTGGKREEGRLLKASDMQVCNTVSGLGHGKGDGVGVIKERRSQTAGAN